MPSFHLRVENLLTGLAIALLVASGTTSACGAGDYPGLPSALASRPAAAVSDREPVSSKASSKPPPPAPDAGRPQSTGGASLAVPSPAPPPAWPTALPAPTGSCPELVDGSLTFAPAGMKARSVRIWVSPGAAAVRDGPLVFYWHAAGSQPAEAVESLSQAVIDAVTAAGGVVAALYSDPDAGTLPWFLSDEGPSGRDDDLRVADEVVGCAAAKPGLDLRQIHTLGLGAGAAQAAQMSYRRSSYVASAAVYSGGFDERLGLPANQAPANRFPALIFHGPASGDLAPEPRRARAAYTYWSDLTAHRHFAAVCLHSGGEIVPSAAPQLVWDFFRQHPYGQDPSPWADGLPETFPGSCALVPEADPPKPAPVSLRGGQKRWDLEALRRVRG